MDAYACIFGIIPLSFCPNHLSREELREDNQIKGV